MKDTVKAMRKDYRTMITNTLRHTDRAPSRRFRLPAAIVLALMLSLAFLAVPCSTVSAAAVAGTAQVVSDTDSPDRGIFSAIAGIFKKGGSRPVVDEVSYDRKDREVDFEFTSSVSWKSPKVKITSYNGKKTYKGKITDKDSDELEYKLNRSSKLTYGNYYRYKISGIKKRGSGSYTTISGTFRAVDD